MSNSNEQADDWVDVYFSIQKELGLDITFKLGRGSDSEQVEWTTLSHHLYDGIGGFAHRLREEGWPVNKLPVSRESKPPSRLSMVVPMVRYAMGRKQVTPVEWKEEISENKLGAFTTFSAAFNTDETNHIIKSAKQNQVTVNTLLLESINKISAKHLQKDSEKNIWVVPVNIRGAIKRKRDTSNHVSFFPVSINKDQKLEEIQNDTRTNLEKKTQWVTWHFLNLTGKKKGRDGIYDMVKSTIDTQLGVTGVFSNLGAWPLKNDLEPMTKHSVKVNDNSTWFLSPNVTAAVPIGATAVTWFGKLGLTFVVHPFISEKQDIGQKIIDEWRADLLKNYKS